MRVGLHQRPRRHRVPQCFLWTAHGQRHRLLRVHDGLVREHNVAQFRVLILWFGVGKHRGIGVNICTVYVPVYSHCWRTGWRRRRSITKELDGYNFRHYCHSRDWLRRRNRGDRCWRNNAELLPEVEYGHRIRRRHRRWCVYFHYLGDWSIDVVHHSCAYIPRRLRCRFRTRGRDMHCVNLLWSWHVCLRDLHLVRCRLQWRLLQHMRAGVRRYRRRRLRAVRQQHVLGRWRERELRRVPVGVHERPRVGRVRRSGRRR